MIIENVPPDQIPATVQHMIDNPGVYLCCNPPKPTEVPVVSYQGSLFSITLDAQLDPTRFIAGTQVEGPFRATIDKDDTIKELCQLRDRLKQLSEAGYEDMEGADADEFGIASDLYAYCAKAAEAIDRAVAAAVKAQAHCDDCDPSFLNCWEDRSQCRKQPRRNAEP